MMGHTKSPSTRREGENILIFGAPHSGKTHFLQCLALQNRGDGKPVISIPLERGGAGRSPVSSAVGSMCHSVHQAASASTL